MQEDRLVKNAGKYGFIGIIQANLVAGNFYEHPDDD